MAESKKPRARRVSADEAASQFLDDILGPVKLEPGTMALLRHDQIIVSEQIRSNVESADIDDLRESISESKGRKLGIANTGVLQPLLVWPETDEDGNGTGRVHLIDGGRRFLATQGIVDKVPCVMVESNEGAARLMQLVANVQRLDVSPLDLARGLDEIRREQNFSIRVLAEAVGKGKGWVEGYLFLLKAKTDVQVMVSNRSDSVAIAREINGLEDELRKKLVEAAQHGASLRDIRRRIDNAKAPKIEPSKPKQEPAKEEKPGAPEPAQDSSSTTPGEAPVTEEQKPEPRSSKVQPTKEEARDVIGEFLEPAIKSVAEAARVFPSLPVGMVYRSRITQALVELRREVEFLEALLQEKPVPPKENTEGNAR